MCSSTSSNTSALLCMIALVAVVIAFMAFMNISAQQERNAIIDMVKAGASPMEATCAITARADICARAQGMPR